MGFLDEKGLARVWEKVRAGLSGKQDKLSPDGSIELGEDGAVAVAVPVKAMTRAEYAALSEEEKEAEALYVVDEPAWVPAPLSVQEYATEDGWRVRKWSDGYVEMSVEGEAVVDVTIQSVTGGLYQCGAFGRRAYPVELVEKFSEMRSASAPVSVIPTYSPGEGYDPLKMTLTINLYRPMKAPALAVTYSFFVTGRWK